MSIENLNKNLYNDRSERTHQYNVFKWATLNQRLEPRLWLLNSSQNGLVSNSYSVQGAKKLGLKNGYPDIFLPASGMFEGKILHGLFIELKKIGGKATKEQLIWQQKLKEQGYASLIIQGANNAIHAISQYLDFEYIKGVWYE